MKYLLYNPLANNKQCKQKVDEFAKTAGECEFKDVTKLDAKAFVESMNAEDEAYLFGGDGTVNHFANDTYGADIKANVYYVPSGTGNDFFNDVKNEQAEKDGYILLNPFLKNLPTVYVNDIEKHFVNGIGYGLDGMCCQVADDQMAKGKTKINYTSIAVSLLLFKYKPKNAKVVVDGEEKTYDKVWILPTMKGRFYGGGMMVAPAQDRLDFGGKVTVVVFRGKPRIKVLMNFTKIFTGEHVKLKGMIDIRSGKDVYVEYDEPTALQIDGETVRNVKSYRVKA